MDQVYNDEESQQPESKIEKVSLEDINKQKSDDLVDKVMQKILNIKE